MVVIRRFFRGLNQKRVPMTFLSFNELISNKNSINLFTLNIMMTYIIYMVIQASSGHRAS